MRYEPDRQIDARGKLNTSSYMEYLQEDRDILTYGGLTWIGNIPGHATAQVYLPENGIIAIISSDSKPTITGRLLRDILRIAKLRYTYFDQRPDTSRLLSHLSATENECVNIVEMGVDQIPSLQGYPSMLIIQPEVSPGDVYEIFNNLPLESENKNSSNIPVLITPDYVSSPPLEHAHSIKQLFYSNSHAVTQGGYIENGWMVFRDHIQRETVFPLEEVSLPGSESIDAILAALSAAKSLGISAGIIHRAIKSFAGVSHRLEFVAEVGGARFYNDSISSTPERVLYTLQQIDSPLTLIAGGRLDDSCWDTLAEAILRKVRVLLLIGESVASIQDAIDKARAIVPLDDCALQIARQCPDLENAVQLASDLARPLESVVLSPGCASYDMFSNYQERGEKFLRIVRSLEVTHDSMHLQEMH